MRPGRVLAAALGGLSLGGCAVGPNYVRPETPAPARFIGQDAVAQRVVDAPAPDLTTWWRGFNDPLLARYVELGLQQNLDLAQAMARVQGTRAALGAATAALLPSADVNGSAGRQRLSVATEQGRLLSGFPGFERDASSYELDLGASWEIDLFGGLRRSREAARADYQGSRAGVAAARVAVAAETADTYVLIRELQARLAVARAQIDTQRRLLETVQLQYRKGVAAELQVDQAQGALRQVEATAPALEAALDQALDAFDVLLGAQPGTHRQELLAEAPIPAAPAIVEAGGPAELLRRRPDLIVAERSLASANARVGAAISEYYPKVSLSGLLGTAAAGTGQLFTDASQEASGVAGLRWRLFDFGRVNAEIGAARGRYAEALAAYKLAVLRASQDVEDNFAVLVRREAEARTLTDGEGSLDRARKASLAAYKGGVVSLIEVLDADSRYLGARDARVQAQADAARAAIAAFRALGGGWNAEAEGPRLAQAGGGSAVGR